MKTAYLLLATALASLSVPAFAEEPGTSENPDGKTDEITVTATRRASSLQSTPVTVSALGSEDLAKLGIQRVDQVAAQVPNFYMQPGIANSSTISLSMRGRGDNAGGFGTTEQPVSFYFDDVYQARPSAVNSELADIERIEVLRGPQGTLFGRNSMVGAVNVITRTPDDVTYGSASASYGNYQTLALKGSLGGALVPGALAASISGVFRDQGKGYMHNVATGKDIDERDFWGLRGKLHFYGSDVWDVVLAASFTRNRNDGFVTSPYASDMVTPLTGDGRDTATTAPQAGSTDTLGLSAHVEADLGVVTVRSITGYSTVKDYWSVDLVGGTIDKFGDYVMAYNRRSRIKQHQWTEELQLFGDALDGDLSWIVGGFYFTETTRQSFNDTMYNYWDTDTSTPDAFTTVPELYYRNRANSYAGYAQVSYKPFDGFEVVAGGRYTYETKQIDGYFSPAAEDVYGDTSHYSAVTPKFGINYQASPDVFLYGSISRGFRAGGYTSAANSREVGETPFGPEKVWAYELGLKSDLLDRKLRLNFAAFMNDFTDILVGRFIDGTAISVQFNGMSYRAIGLELELNVKPVEGLDIYANGGVQKVGNIAYVAGAQVSKPISIPNYTGSTGFRYETGLSGDGVYRLRFGGDFIFRDSTYGDLDHTLITRTSTVRELNGEISVLRDDGWKFSLIGKNLANRFQWQNGLNFSFMGAYGRQPMLPRTFMAEISYAF
ncbi:TonB-dependent receptor [Novosphingobium profundi]|uniref:TonB-dependent receptor n=1 Tax=Novosphingobium profundi TaxID=1774954 RepID=UPI001BDB3858|nr:TonB-dependent receptor [Novosphingobium profundi]MBT0671459.1 TonB-dependent receptor [Novosphingobium profundi]